jgi:hypothetical protein
LREGRNAPFDLAGLRSGLKLALWQKKHSKM